MTENLEPKPESCLQRFWNEIRVPFWIMLASLGVIGFVRTIHEEVTTAAIGVLRGCVVIDAERGEAYGPKCVRLPSGRIAIKSETRDPPPPSPGEPVGPPPASVTGDAESASLPPSPDRPPRSPGPPPLSAGKAPPASVTGDAGPGTPPSTIPGETPSDGKAETAKTPTDQPIRQPPIPGGRAP